MQTAEASNFAYIRAQRVPIGGIALSGVILRLLPFGSSCQMSGS